MIKNGNGKTVFTEQLSLSKHAALAEITDKRAMVSSGLYYLSTDSSMSFVKNTASSKTLPSGAFITNNSSKKAIAGIGSDGNIYLLDTTYSLGYTEDTGHLAIIIKNASGQEIGRAIYAISAEFILR